MNTHSQALRIAVVGVGYLGRHHARILAELEGAHLVGIVDARPERAAQYAAQYGVEAMTSVEALDGRVDAVTIATPTESHADLACGFLERGVHVLVEKPMARTLAEADRMLDAASRGGTVLAVGHTERFNPAVTAALGVIDRPGFVEIHRLGTFPERSLDIDVVFDLMIHDLDVLLATVPGEVVGVEAVGVPVLTRRVDIANARLRFSSGCIANVTASRISRDRVRKVRFFQRDAYISIDYAAQEVERYALEPGPSGVPAIAGGRIEVVRDEPLRAELADFVGAVRERRAPRVTGAQGRAALDLATRITSAIDAEFVATR
ncbi:MAG: Gfo/Idh/MocA family oxidoreductase [Vicinamibacteraceae bacterium]|nr:Gfo/Idh/MocA family oxidoreductase [Vicinamibacteraceae bacterium]